MKSQSRGRDWATLISREEILLSSDSKEGKVLFEQMDHWVREKIDSRERRDYYHQTTRKEKSSIGSDHKERQGSGEHGLKYGSLASHDREGSGGFG